VPDALAYDEILCAPMLLHEIGEPLGVNANRGSAAIASLAGVVAGLAVVRSALSVHVASASLSPKRDSTCSHRPGAAETGASLMVSAARAAAPAHRSGGKSTVMRFRELVRSQAVRSALERSSDTLFAFALRALAQVISDQSRTNRETINQLWDALDDPHLNQALGLPQKSRMTRR
jgi:hypothetical protein